ncbi:hypothetical protein LEP1GSC083_3139 [Leptospira interrogans serovar Pyrogenes str. L0374]|uniref:Uncharacterized protein n=3 Tax=Leptospira interrogans TaxID=173 RepID=A0A0E2DDG8_LEPIR|nr:hypothetical protein LEP1GSC080_1365 [Leptospira interrogans str. FPW2026]EKO04461.1 hypothetical protein LEP1GSC077_0092 [Leptospira interrogans str. C10069]EKO25027.1 hypothetical protein LEP1GSC104_0520 [Leptospira interrogans str. UI 12621]EKR53701.1 hypothetical protein LEP1GSC105_0390 [Leptospira interrogans str. UI 12758]EMN30628.1 hypothetical protein LEP1GSC083_3139 [Leptospira interrogans serovar Pyrogenes str. L0374]EMN61118.1 hypothetical protein LEP1GSC092_1979 [Leptospira inte
MSAFARAFRFYRKFTVKDFPKTSTFQNLFELPSLNVRRFFILLHEINLIYYNLLNILPAFRELPDRRFVHNVGKTLYTNIFVYSIKSFRAFCVVWVKKRKIYPT